jgi:hypothetical protein
MGLFWAKAKFTKGKLPKAKECMAKEKNIKTSTGEVFPYFLIKRP